jgi:hypothetical protein
MCGVCVCVWGGGCTPIERTCNGVRVEMKNQVNLCVCVCGVGGGVTVERRNHKNGWTKSTTKSDTSRKGDFYSQLFLSCIAGEPIVRFSYTDQGQRSVQLVKHLSSYPIGKSLFDQVFWGF